MLGEQRKIAMVQEIPEKNPELYCSIDNGQFEDM